jgi:hypothetical protein
MQASSASYVVLDSTTGSSNINMDAASSLPGTTGNASVQAVGDHVEISNTFGQSETGRKAVCVNPSYLIGGVQLFVAFKIPKTLPTGTAVEIWLNEAGGQHKAAAKVSNENGNLVFSLTIGSDSHSDSIVLATNVYYVLLVSVDASGAFATAQVIDLKNKPVATVEVFVTNDGTGNALASNPFYICMSLANSFGRRQHANKDVELHIKYYGTQRVGTAGTLQLKGGTVGMTAGAIVGAIIGSLIGCLLLVCVATAIILLVGYKMQKNVPVKQELEDLESPVITNLELQPQPVEEKQEVYQIPEQPIIVEHNIVEVPQRPETPLVVDHPPSSTIEPEEITLLSNEEEQLETENLPIESSTDAAVTSHEEREPEPTLPLEQEPEQEDAPEEVEPETEAVEPEPVETVTLGIEADLTLDDEGKKVLGEMKDIITEIRGKVSKITNKNISELQAYATPPPVVFSVLRAALIVLGYDADELSKWGTCKKSLKDGFLKKVTQFDPTDASHASKKFKLAQEEINELDYETCLKKGSLPTAIICEWVRGVLKIRYMAVQLRNKE